MTVNDAITNRLQKEIAYDVNGNPEFVGTAPPGAATSAPRWRIQKLIYSGSNVVSVRFADGTAGFGKVWDNRASYTYTI